MAKNDRWQESIDSINRSLKLVDEVNRSKILIGAAANERHIARFVGSIFFPVFCAIVVSICFSLLKCLLGSRMTPIDCESRSLSPFSSASSVTPVQSGMHSDSDVGLHF